MLKKKKKAGKNTPKNDFIKETAEDAQGPSWKLNRSFFVDPKTKKVLGFVSLVLAVYLLIAFLSCLSGCWKSDQSIVDASKVDIIGGSATKVCNNMGFAGAWLGNLFVYNWFGIAAILIPVILAQIGTKQLFDKQLLQPKNLIVKLIFGGVLISMLAGLIFYSTNAQIWAGGFGISAFMTLKSIIGTIGYVLFLALFIVVYGTYAFSADKWIPALGFIRKLLNNDPAKSIDDGQELPSDEHSIAEPVAQNNSIESPIIQPLETKKDMLDFELIEKEDTGVIDFTDSLPPESEKPKKSKPILTDAADLDLVIEDKKEEEEVTKKVEHGDHLGVDTAYDPTLDLSNYQFPPIDLLKQYEPQDAAIDREELEQSKNMIVETLKNYKIGISSIKANIGPTVTLYEIIPAPGVKISKIKNLEDDIALSLAALGIRIIAPIPGKGAIGIEVPNKNPQLVSMHSVITSRKFQETTFELPVCLGKTISNDIYVADLAKMPHLLMAGATGQGKSVGLNALLISLLYKKHPSTIKFVLVDPKKVELTLFNKIERHYLAKLPGDNDAIITDNKQVIHTLNSLCIEMDDRYSLLQNAHVRNIKDYNKKFVERKLNPNDGHKFLPYIVVVIDEVADLIMTAGKEVEHPIGRLAQLARAIGIHLVLATQRPSVNIITGTIKANFPARIAFRVTSKIDSRTILDGNGADQLIGRGDMLYSTGSDMQRLQCPFVDTPEVEAICDFIGEQRGYSSAFILPEYKGEEASGSGDFDMNERDALFEDAARVLVTAQQGSTSLIQRKMKIGYNRAGRIIDQLEAAGIVGPFEGSKAREVLIPDEYALELFLKNLQDES